MAAYLGIDWGTHSSKWAYQMSRGNPVIGSIWDSAVTCIDGKLSMFTLEEHFQDQRRELGLKRKLIQDPDQSFWEGPRPKLGTTLGEAVVFSLLVLLSDATSQLAKRGKGLLEVSPLSIRFSHPNWISADNVRALSCFRDAVVVALGIFADGIGLEFGERCFRMPVDALRKAVQDRRQLLANLPEFPDHYQHAQYLDCSEGEVNGIKWQLVFESCAAGFPYLLEGERETFEEELTKFPEHDRIRKILVVDVGAGSTDAGYMIRTIRPRNKQGIMKPLLIWLPAADALEIAGRWLTDKIHAEFKQQGRTVTQFEVEDFKISRHQDWYEKPYVHEWTEHIAEHIREYVRTIQNDKWLPANPTLEVVITGGSSAVKPMREAVLNRTRTALCQRGLGEEFSYMTHLIEPKSDFQLNRAYRDIELAQLAVCLGASDPLLTEFKSYAEFLA